MKSGIGTCDLPCSVHIAMYFPSQPELGGDAFMLRALGVKIPVPMPKFCLGYLQSILHTHTTFVAGLTGMGWCMHAESRAARRPTAITW